MKISSLGRESTKSIICILLLLAITLTVFQYTMEIRAPWFGELSPGHHQWLTGSTLEYSKNWYREGPLTLKFAMLDNPRSIEFPTLSSRGPYTSYPPGAIIPVYIISKIEGYEPTPGLVMEYNLWNHFSIAFFLSLIVFFFFLQIKFDHFSAFLFSTIPIFIELLLPAPLYWHQNVFFTDQAVILPFVLFIFLEVIRGYNLNKNVMKVLNIFQALIMFYGVLTDWFYIFIALIVYIKRIVNGEVVMSKENHPFFMYSLKYWFPSMVALSLFIFQVYVFGTFYQTLSRFLLRAGLPAAGQVNTTNFLGVFLGHMYRGYGEVATIALLVGLSVFIVVSSYLIFQHFRKQKTDTRVKKTLYLMGMLMVPCFLQICAFRNHILYHDFSVLKFSVPLAIVPFVLIPFIFFLLFENYRGRNLKSEFKTVYNPPKRSFGFLIIFLFTSALVGGLIINEHPKYKEFFPEVNHGYKTLGGSIEKNTKYEDVVFSPDFEIPSAPPQQLSYSMKRVYQVNSWEAIKNKTKKVVGDYRIVVVFLNQPREDGVLKNATKMRDDDLYYYILDPQALGSM